MAQTGTYYAGTYGLPLNFELHVSLAEVTAITLEITQPNGTKITRNLVPGDVITDEQLGNFSYTLASDDIPVPGNYVLRITITKSGGRVLTARTNMTVL